jgi:hypothetical protein
MARGLPPLPVGDWPLGTQHAVEVITAAYIRGRELLSSEGIDDLRYEMAAAAMKQKIPIIQALRDQGVDVIWVDNVSTLCTGMCELLAQAARRTRDR